MKRRLFVVQTHYQLLNALSMCVDFSKDSTNDLLLADNLKSFFEVLANLKEVNYVHNVYTSSFLEDSSTDFKKGLTKKISQISKYRKYFFSPIEEVLGFQPSETYNELFFVKIGSQEHRIFNYYFSKNKETRWFLYDDGVGSYIHASIKYQKLYLVLEKINERFKKINYFQKYSGLFLNHPENVIFKQENIFQIPNHQNNRFKELLVAIYQPELQDFSNKTIFFQAGFWDEQEVQVEKEAILALQKEVGAQNFLLKMHPRLNNAEDYPGVAIMQQEKIPWEVIMLTSDITNTRFVSIFSTASISLYEFFNAENQTIFLYKILPKWQETYGDLNQYFCKVAEKQKGKIHIVENLSQAIEKLKEERRL